MRKQLSIYERIAFVAIPLAMGAAVPLLGFFLYRWVIGMLPIGEALTEAAAVFWRVPPELAVRLVASQMTPFVILAAYLSFVAGRFSRVACWKLLAVSLAGILACMIPAYFTFWSAPIALAFSVLFLASEILLVHLLNVSGGGRALQAL